MSEPAVAKLKCGRSTVFVNSPYRGNDKVSSALLLSDLLRSLLWSVKLIWCAVLIEEDHKNLEPPMPEVTLSVFSEPTRLRIAYGSG